MQDRECMWTPVNMVMKLTNWLPKIMVLFIFFTFVTFLINKELFDYNFNLHKFLLPSLFILRIYTYCTVVLWQMPCILMQTVTDSTSVEIYGRWINIWYHIIYMIWYDIKKWGIHWRQASNKYFVLCHILLTYSTDRNLL